MVSYVAQRKESFTGEIQIAIEKIIMCGVSILTNHPLCNEVFNYSGVHSLFDAVATQFCSHFFVPLVVTNVTCGGQLDDFGEGVPWTTNQSESLRERLSVWFTLLSGKRAEGPKASSCNGSTVER
jgi:hypothetical protein